MLQSLIYLDDREIILITDAVRQWCSGRKVDVDSVEGRRAVTAAVDLVQTTTDRDRLLAELSKHLDHQ